MPLFQVTFGSGGGPGVVCPCLPVSSVHQAVVEILGRSGTIGNSYAGYLGEGGGGVLRNVLKLSYYKLLSKFCSYKIATSGILKEES